MREMPKFEKIEVLFHQRHSKNQRQNYMNYVSNCFCMHRVCSRSVPQRLLLQSDHKRVQVGKKCSEDAEIIADRQAYFEVKDKLYYKNYIGKLDYGKISIVEVLLTRSLIIKLNFDKKMCFSLKQCEFFQLTDYSMLSD